MGKRKYFFFDIDNTIAIGFPRVVPESTRRAIKALQDKGHYVSIATGRMLSLIHISEPTRPY